MKLLLPMAYIFFILEKNLQTNGKPISSNDNLTYRLMEIETDADVNDENQWTSYPVYDEEAYASEYVLPRVQTSFVKKRRRRPSTTSHYDNRDERPSNDEIDDDNGDNGDDDENQNDIRSTTKKKIVRIPDDKDEETSTTLRIPKRRQPKRISKKTKAKKSNTKRGSESSKPNDIDDDFKPSKTKSQINDNPDENNYDQREEEEEEEMEEKEKIRKVTIKKKRPTKNVTRIVEPVRESYETIVQSKPAASIPNRTRQRYPPLFRPVSRKKRPSLTKNNAERLSPTFYNRLSTLPPKNIKSRDVNFVVRGRNPSGPRILIRRYKQFIAPINGYSFLNRAAITKNKLNKYRFGPKKGKKLALKPFSSRQLCVKQLPRRTVALAGAKHYKTLYPYSQVEYKDDNNDGEDDDDVLTVNSPTNGYATSEREKHVPGSFTAIRQQNTNIPRKANVKNQRLTTSTTEETMSIPYDIREHKNTEELADVHAKETDENIDKEEETDPIGYDDIEVEGVDENELGDDRNTEYDGEIEDNGQESDKMRRTNDN